MRRATYVKIVHFPGCNSVYDNCTCSAGYGLLWDWGPEPERVYTAYDQSWRGQEENPEEYAEYLRLRNKYDTGRSL